MKKPKQARIIRHSEKGKKAISRLDTMLTERKLDPHNLIMGDASKLTPKELKANIFRILEKTDMPINIKVEQVENALTNLIGRKSHITRTNLLLEAIDHMGYAELKKTFGVKAPKGGDKEAHSILLRRTLVRAIETQGEMDIVHWSGIKLAHDAIKNASGIDFVSDLEIEDAHPPMALPSFILKSWGEFPVKKGNRKNDGPHG